MTTAAAAPVKYTLLQKYRWLIWAIFLAPPAVVVGLTIYWAYFTQPILWPDAKNPWMLELSDYEVEPGEEVVATFYSCKTDQATGTWSRALVDTVEWSLVTDQSSRLPLGCGWHAIVQRIPDAAPDGAYRLAISAEYQVNPLVTQRYKFISKLFTVKRVKPLPPLPQRIIINPPWSSQRDKELRDRIRRLEQWRYRTEGKSE